MDQALDELPFGKIKFTVARFNGYASEENTLNVIMGMKSKFGVRQLPDARGWWGWQLAGARLVNVAGRRLLPPVAFLLSPRVFTPGVARLRVGETHD